MAILHFDIKLSQRWSCYGNNLFQENFLFMTKSRIQMLLVNKKNKLKILEGINLKTRMVISCR